MRECDVLLMDGWRFGVTICESMGRLSVLEELAFMDRGGWTGWAKDWQRGYAAALRSAVGRRDH